ncbi:hypothetical protein HUG10_07225 [Halorarum halophilum]|uniref:Uncharacterized protein n=1 Tax=Halorarum halophilum TaxID=2743090 RepID=A0A7D5GH96_9EURY|nr:hypothetical protein [Halobaculum halophilum]QLG27351.1 hypothetical protein HUG10_07225 [Halobaculum halophilum]
MDAEELRERATIDRLEPPVYDLDEPLWTAEDPVTECVGFGYVEEEAFGNLASAITRYENESDGTRYRKVPGRFVRRTDADEGLIDAVKRALGRG